jgi:hypothetical protein
MDTSAYEDIYQGKAAYVLENEHIKAYFSKIGSPSNQANYNTNQILLGIYQKDLGEWMPLQNLEISLDGNPQSETGSGYTILEQTGTDLPYATVSAYMNSTSNYFVNFTLESDADFLTIEGGEV